MRQRRQSPPLLPLRSSIARQRFASRFYAISIERKLENLGISRRCRPEVPLRQAIRRLLEAGYAHQHMVTGLAQLMRHVPRTAYARCSAEIRNRVHPLIVSFLESRGPREGLDDPELAADVILAQCEGLTFLGRTPRTAPQQISILTDVFCALESFPEAGPRSRDIHERRPETETMSRSP